MPNTGYRKRRLHKGRLLFCITVVLVIIAGILTLIHRYNHPSLIGKWQSQETQKTVTFHRDGRVTLSERKSEASFKKLTETTLNYTIEGSSFEMYYLLESRTLAWGMTEDNVELFRRR